MRGRTRSETEVLRGIHQAPSEKLLPGTVHGDARRQRIVAGNKPASQCESGRLADLGGSGGNIVGVPG